MSQGLYDILSGHLSDHKKVLFERVACARTRHIVLVSEDIYQTQNASAILRSAECWGVQDIYVIENSHSFQVHRRIAKGSEDWLNLHRYHAEANNTRNCLNDLRSKGYKIVTTSTDDDAIPLHELDVRQPIAVVMGSELSGVSMEAIEMSDDKVHIPMYGFTESLNVSVASAVILQSLVGRMRREVENWQLSEAEQLEIKIEWAKKSVYWSDYLVQMFEQGELK